MTPTGLTKKRALFSAVHAFVDRLIPSIYLESGFEIRRRSRLLIIFSLFMTLIGVSYALLYWVGYKIYPTAIVLSLNAIGGALIPYVFQRTKSFLAASIQLLTVGLSTLTGVSLTTGGFVGAAPFWFMSIPVLAMVLHDARHGIIWYFVTLVIGMLIYFTSSFGLPNYIEPSLRLGGVFQSWLGISFLMPSLVTLFESAKNRMMAEIEEKRKELLEKNTRIKTIFDGVNVAIFKINLDGKIDPEYSNVTESILETSNLCSTPIEDILFFAEDDMEKRQILKSGLQICLGEDLYAFELNKNCFPTDIEYEKSGKKYLEISWTPIVADDIISGLSVAIRDVTDIRNLELKNIESTSEINILKNIVDFGRDKIFIHIASDRKLVEATKSLLRNYDLSADSVPIGFENVKRNLHTIKGNSRTYGLHDVSKIIHSCENELSKSGSFKDKCELILNCLEYVDGIYARYIAVIEKYLQKSGNHFEENMAKSLAFVSLLKDIKSHSDSEGALIEDLIGLIKMSIGVSLSDIMGPIENDIPRVCESLQKPAPIVNYPTKDCYFHKDSAPHIKSILGHLVRNSLDHGIEMPSDRVKKGKSEEGNINILVTRQGGKIDFILNDDGSGLDMKRIYDKAVQLGRLEPTGKYTMQEIAYCIFMKDFSTKDSATEISGRGVGMDVVMHTVRQMKGDIRIEPLTHSRELDLIKEGVFSSIPCRFVMQFPDFVCI